MDVMMPLKNGIDACREITEMLPDTKTLILTASAEEDAVMEAVAASATGFLQKYSGKEKLLATVREVADGEYRIPSNVLRSVFAGIRGTAEQKTTDGPKSLTQRDREILTLFAQGLSYAEIAEVRNNQPLTIRNAIYSIQDKLGIDTKQELVVWAVRNGLWMTSRSEDELCRTRIWFWIAQWAERRQSATMGYERRNWKLPCPLVVSLSNHMIGAAGEAHTFRSRPSTGSG